MASQDELRALRRELDDLVGKARVLASRIEALERRDRQKASESPHVESPAREAQEAPPAVETAEEPVPTPGAVPPPLPVGMRAEADPEPEPVQTAHAEPIDAATKQPAMSDRIRAFIDARVDTTQQGWEIALATYVLPRIGVLVLTIAVVLGLTMAANQGGPITRVALGYAAAGALLGLAAWLENKYRLYARVLFSGGFALSYFVTFATHYIEYARVIENPAITLIMLAVVVITWAALAQWWQSRTMAVFVTALGHLTFALSVITEEELSNFPVAGLVLLAAGSAFFLLRNRWYYVAFLGIIGSYANHFFWMANSEGNDLPIEFWASMVLSGLFFLIFALSELFSPEALRREHIPTWFRSFFVTLNTACFFGIGSLLVDGFSFTNTEHDTFCYVFAIVLLAIGFAYLHVRGLDPLYNAYITKGVVIFTLGLAYTFGDNALATSLAVEAVALLVSARRSGLVVTRILAFGAAALAFAVAADTLSTQSPIGYGEEGYSALLAQAAITVLSLFALAVLYMRTDWTHRLPELAWIAEPTRATLSQFDLCKTPPSAVGKAKFLNGLAVPYVYSIGGAVLYVFYASVLVREDRALPVLAVAALALTATAALLNAKPLGLAAVGLTGVAGFVSTVQWLSGGSSQPETAIGILGLAVLVVNALAVERRFVPNREGLAFHQSAWGPYFFYSAFTIPLGFCLSQEFDELQSSVALALAAAALAGAYLVLHPGALAALAAYLFGWAAYFWAWYDAPDWWPYLGVALIAASLGGDRFFAWTKRGPTAQYAGPTALVLGWLVALRLAQELTEDAWFAHAAIAVAFGYMIYGAGFRSIPSAAVSLIAAAIASGYAVIYAFDETWDVATMSLAFGACAVYWIALEREDQFAGRRFVERFNTPVHGIFIAFAVVIGIIALERVPQFRDFYLTVAWTVLALAIFGVSALTREKYYRYAGLAVFALALGRAFLHDALNLEGIQRVAAFGVLGVVLLIVAFGYIYAVRGVQERGESNGTPEDESREG